MQQTQWSTDLDDAAALAAMACSIQTDPSGNFSTGRGGVGWNNNSGIMNADRHQVAMGRDGVANSFGREDVAPAEQTETDEDTLESDESYQVHQLAVEQARQSFGVGVPGGGGSSGGESDRELVEHGFKGG